MLKYFIFILFILLSCLDLNCSCDRSQDRQYPNLHAGPIIQDVTVNKAGIIWHTTKEEQFGLIYWKAKHPPRSLSISPHPITITDVLFKRKLRLFRYHAILQGLEPYTVYFYRISSPSILKIPGRFRTKPDKPEDFRFLVYGDSRYNRRLLRTYTHHREIVTEMLGHKADFLVHTGDMVFRGNRRRDWRRFFMTAGPLLAKLPFYPAFGNHERGGETTWKETFLMPDEGIGRPYYSFIHARSLFLFLDTNRPYKPESPQYNWLIRELSIGGSHPEIHHIFVVHHHPVFSHGPHEIHPDMREVLLPLYESHKVDLVISGHSHAYEHIEYRGIHFIVSGGGGAPLVPLNDPLKKEFDYNYILGISDKNYSLIQVSREGIMVQTWNAEGNELDRFRIN